MFIVELKDFTVAGVHINPNEAPEELKLMKDVHEYAVNRFGSQVILVQFYLKVS